MEGLRVHEDARNKGLGERTTCHLVEVARDLKVRRIRLATSGDNIAPIKLAARVGMKQIVKYQVFWKGYRRNIKWRYDTIDVNEIHPRDVIDFIEERAELVPHNALVKH
jgi:GNAT superfamily N-acetyltransferase